VEQFSAWQLRERQVSAAIVNRRLSTLSSFYKWALKHEIVEGDPVYLADKPKRPLRIPVWLEREEQAAGGDAQGPAQHPHQHLRRTTSPG
jgi:integrase/recombinase XerD